MKVLLNKETGAQGAAAPQTDNAAKGGDSQTAPATTVVTPTLEEQVKAAELEVTTLQATLEGITKTGMQIPAAFQSLADSAKAKLESLKTQLKTEGAVKEVQALLTTAAGKLATHVKETITVAVTIVPGENGGNPTIMVSAKGARNVHSVKTTGDGTNAPKAQAIKVNGQDYPSKRKAFDALIADPTIAAHVKSFVDMANKGTSFNASLPLEKLAAAGLIKIG